MNYTIVAHRGNAAEYPENSLAALQSAHDLGARWMEIDVQLSRDAVPVVFHDSELRRLLQRDGNIHDSASTDLIGAALDRGAYVPSLAQVAAWLASAADTQLFVELKRASIERHGVEVSVAATLAALGPVRERAVFISFDAAAVAAAGLSGMRRAWVLPSYDGAHEQQARALQPEFLFVDVQKIPAQGPLWRGPWQWCTYEVTTPAAAAALRQRGIEWIETMQVRRLLQAVPNSASTC